VTKRCDKVNLSAEAEEAVIQFCRQHEEQLSYKSVINCVKELKYKVILASFGTRIQSETDLFARLRIQNFHRSLKKRATSIII
jgi:hypothetical protein